MHKIIMSFMLMEGPSNSVFFKKWDGGPRQDCLQIGKKKKKFAS